MSAMSKRSGQQDAFEKKRAASNVRLAVMLGIIVILLYVSFILLNAKP